MAWAIFGRYVLYLSSLALGSARDFFVSRNKFRNGLEHVGVFYCCFSIICNFPLFGSKVW